MTIDHIVLIEKKNDAMKEQMDAALKGIAGLKDKIPGILDVKIGNNFTDRTPNISHAAIITMADKQALSGYGPHPAHEQVIKLLHQAASNWIVVDIET